MAGTVDKIACEFGVKFIAGNRTVQERHESKARRTVMKLLAEYGEPHLRLVFNLINTPRNRGNWEARVFKAVSGLILRRPDISGRADFVEMFDEVDLAQIQRLACKTNPSAPTVTLSVLLTYKMDELIEARERAAA